MTYEYKPDDKFGYKDTLPEGHDEKIIKGSEFDDEFKKISNAFKVLDPDFDGDIEIGGIDGLQDALDGKADQSALEKEIQDRKDGDQALQNQIDALDPDGDRTVNWSEVEGKPTEFPPEAHGHEIDDVNGLQDALDAAGGTPAWDDVTGKPTEFPPEAHTHEQSEVDGLELRLEAIEGSITDGGGFVDAPDDGLLYGRQSEAWAEIVIPDAGASSWNDLTDKPTEFPPASHNHDGVYQPVGDYIGEAPNDGEEYARKSQGWVKLQDHNYTGADAVKLTGDQSVAGHKTWTGVATFGDTVTMRGTLNGDDTANFQNAVTSGSFVKTGGTSDQYLMADGSVSAGQESGGGSVQIGDEPSDPQEGDQWLEIPADGDAIMWVYDGEKWLQMPGAGGGSVTVTTSDVQLDQPTLRMPSGATTQADANSYFATALQNVVDEDGNSLVDLSEYYTSTEADANFQPKGDYIEDAPSDGELYVRKDGAWELYTPSSGGAGGGNLIDPIIQPVVVGDFSISASVGYWKTSTYRPNDASGKTVNFPIPNGYKFILLNIQAYNLAIWAKEINIDDVMIYGPYDDSVFIDQGKFLFTGDGQIGKPNFLVSDKITIHTRSNHTNGYVKIYGMFIPADSTFESAEIRDAYIAANAEAWAALPPPEPEPEEVGTQEVPDE